MRHALIIRSTLIASLAGLALGPTGPVSAQGDTGWTTYWENDSFVLFGGSDRSYTNGLRLVWGGGSSPVRTFRGDLERAWERRAWVGRFSETTSAWAVGQNFFTPSTITDYEVDPRDRPFAGIAYAGLRLDTTGKPSALADARVRPSGLSFTRRHSLEVNVGMLGAASGDRVFQTFAHVLRENRIPKGWRHQLPHEPYVAVSSSWRMRIGWHFLDVTPHVGAHLSTVQTYPYAGATLRVGFNMSDFPSLLVRSTAIPERQRPDWEVALVTGVEGRAMAHNAFVEGGFRSDSEGVPAEALVGDWRVGFSVRVTDWRLTWTQVRRSPEIDDESNPFRRFHDYGSVSFGYEPGRRTAADREGTLLGGLIDDVLAPALRGFLLEAGTGPADATGAAGALASRFGVAKRFWNDRVAVGGEIAGMGREFGPPPFPGGDHEDLFLVNKLITARLVPFGELGPGRLHVRAGAGRGLHKRQVTPGEPGPRPVADPCPPGTVLEPDDMRYCNGSETGFGWMLGAGYWLGLPGDQASLGVDYAWNTIRLDEPLEPMDFAIVTLGFQWHPN